MKDRPARRLLGVGLVLLLAACGDDSVTMRRTVTEVDAAPAPAVDGGTEASSGTLGLERSTPAVADRPTPAVPAEPGSGQRATDRGVTDESITLGVITTLSGGQRFVGEPPYRMALAYAADLNERGGINGRRLVVKGYDVCLACPEDALAAAKRAVEQDRVFAIVNGFVANAAPGPAVAYLEEQGIPMLQTASSADLGPLEFQFGIDTPHRGAVDADFVKGYLEERGLPLRVAVLRFATALDEEVSLHQRQALERLGVEVVDEQAVPYGTAMTNQASVVARMRAARPSMVVGSHGVVCAFNMQAATQAGWDVPYLCTILYGDFAIDIAGDAVEGRDVFADSDGFAPLTRSGPGIDHFRRVVANHYPGADVGVITLSSFLGMKVFEDAVTPLGDAVTRAGLLANLGTLRDYDAGGLVPPFTVTPTDHVAIRGAYILRLDAQRRWQPVSEDWVYPDPVHGLPR